jgi:hypothetical protein
MPAMPNRKRIGSDWALQRLLRSEANLGILEGFLNRPVAGAPLTRGRCGAKGNLPLILDSALADGVRRWRVGHRSCYSTP